MGALRLDILDKLYPQLKPVQGGLLIKEKTRAGEYMWGFNGQEKINEQYGEGNAYDFGARILDVRLGRWMSRDPQAGKYPYFSPYVAMGDNPIIYIDPGGETIVVPNVADREPILEMINSKALGTFAFNEAGELHQVKATGDATKYSTYYRDKLVEAINDPDLIDISISQTYTSPVDGTSKDIERSAGGGKTFLSTFEVTTPTIATDVSGVVTVVGYTVTIEKEAKVIISGKAYNSLLPPILDKSRNKITPDAADILLHELVGHAIPKIVGRDTGNAVDNTNKASVQIGPKYEERAADPQDVE